MRVPPNHGWCKIFCSCGICLCLNRGNVRSDPLQGALHPRLTPVVQNDSIAKLRRRFPLTPAPIVPAPTMPIFLMCSVVMLYPPASTASIACNSASVQSPTLSSNVLSDLFRGFRADKDAGDSRKPQLPANC